jgi:hypothetical protein
VLGEPADHYVAGFLLLWLQLMYLLDVSIPCEQKSFPFPLKLIRQKHSPPLRPYSTLDQRVVGVPSYNQNCPNYRQVMKMTYIVEKNIAVHSVRMEHVWGGGSERLGNVAKPHVAMQVRTTLDKPVRTSRMPRLYIRARRNSLRRLGLGAT